MTNTEPIVPDPESPPDVLSPVTPLTPPAPEPPELQSPFLLQNYSAENYFAIASSPDRLLRAFPDNVGPGWIVLELLILGKHSEVIRMRITPREFELLKQMEFRSNA